MNAISALFLLAVAVEAENWNKPMEPRAGEPGTENDLMSGFHDIIGHMMPPELLSNLNETVLNELHAICDDKTKTVSEMKKSLSDWADKYGLTEQYKEVMDNVSTKMNEMSQNMSTIIEKLPEAQTSLEDILHNEDQTAPQIMAAIMEYKQKNPQVFQALKCVQRTTDDQQMSHMGGPSVGMGGPGGLPGPHDNDPRAFPKAEGLGGFHMGQQTSASTGGMVPPPISETTNEN